MRILIASLDPLGNPGGIEGRAESYASNLRDLGHEVCLVSFEPIENPSEGSLDGARLVRLPRSLRGIHMAIRVAVQESSNGLFLLSGGNSLIGLFLLGFCRISRRKSLVLFYGRDILQSRRNPFGSLLTVMAILLSRKVAANSVYTAGLVRREAVRPAIILYPGVDPRISKMGIEVGETKQVLFVGRLVPRKGADILLKSFAQVTQSVPQARLEVVGGGPQLTSLREQAKRLNLDGKVTFHGPLKGEPLWRRYAQCDLLVLPSRLQRDDVEGFGTVFLEAAVFGKPSIGTRTGGIPEAVIDGETGILVDTSEPGALSKAIVALLQDDEKRRTLGRNAKSRAEGIFTWRNSTQVLLKAFGMDAPFHPDAN